MEIYSILEKVIERQSDIQMYYFESETDAVNTIGGQIVCGDIEPNQSYVIFTEPLDDEQANAVMYSYGDIWFLYLVEE